MNNPQNQPRNPQPSYPKMSGVVPNRPVAQPPASRLRPVQPSYAPPYPYPYPPQPAYDPDIQKNAELARVRSMVHACAHEGYNQSGCITFAPKNFTFSTQDRGEEVFILMRTHWISNTFWILRNIFYALIPILIGIILQIFNIEIPILTLKTTTLVLLMYYSVIISNVFRLFFDWYFDPYIVTANRIIQYKFTPFSNYKIREITLREITTIEERSGGILANMFHYGDIGITGEGDVEELTIKRIVNPTKVRDIIADLVDISKKYNG